MPLGPSIVGAATFVAIKFVGYRYAGVKLNSAYGKIASPSPSLFGAARTLLGLAVGVAFAFTVSFWNISHEMLLWFVLLFPVRMLEWSATIWFFYERKTTSVEWPRLVKYSVFGSGWSFALDLPAVLSIFVVPGGMWVC